MAVSEAKPQETHASWSIGESCSKQNVWISIWRLAIVAVLLAAAGITGSFAARYVNSNERKMTENRYEFIALHGLNNLRNGFNSRLLGMNTLAKSIGYYHPNPRAWPNVTMPGFYDTTRKLQELIALDSMAFLPIVTPEELPAFESFMYEHYDTEDNVPAGAGEHNFGKGVYSVDPADPNGTYHDTTGEALLYHSDHKILVPIFQMLLSNDSSVKRLTFNIHSDPRYGPVIDTIIDNCSKKYNYTEASEYCAWVSTSVPLPVATAEDPDPEINNFRSSIIQPIYLNQDSAQLVGFTGGAINWHNLLSQSFENYTGLECVVNDGSVAFTYSIEAAGPSFKGLGDLHDHRADPYGRSIDMSASGAAEFGAAPYSAHIYPTHEFLEQHHTYTAVYVGVGTALIFVLFAAVFVLNDVLLRREGRRQSKMLESKRRFVRFISHEIRTPLNSVHLGLELLAAELIGLVALLNESPRSPLAKTTPPDPGRSADSQVLCSTETMLSIKEMLGNWQELAADMMGNSDSAVDVLNDLLNYDKIEMGTLRLEYSAVAIYPLVEKCTKAFQMQAKQKCVKLKLRGALWDPDHTEELSIQEQERYRNVVVIGDHGRLAQILRNLLSNALKFTPPDGMIEVNVSLAATGLPHQPTFQLTEEHRDLLELPRAGSVQIRVTDSGVGLSPEQLSQICSEGVQFNANKLQAGQGSGLGLFISKGLAMQHGGGLTVASEGLGRGSTFMVELPVRAKQSSPSLAALALRNNTSPRVRSRDSHGTGSGAKTDSAIELESGTSSGSRRKLSQPKRVLVIDDAATNRKMLIRLLKARGYVCEQAEDGQRGIELYQALCERREAVDVIVMDYEMPVMNGPTATKHLRELGCTCLIVGVTGNLLPEDVNYFKRQGANAVLGKPLNMKVFDDVLEDFKLSVGEGNDEPARDDAVPGTAIKTTADRISNVGSSVSVVVDPTTDPQEMV